MTRAAGIGLVLLLLAAAPVRAAVPVQDPDWPCMQRLIPTLTAATYWDGPAATGDWHTDPKIAALVAATAPRDVPQNAAITRLQNFAASLPAADRPATLAVLFAGLVDTINSQRTDVIDRLRELTRRQRDLAQIVEGINDPGPNADPATRDEVVQRRAFLMRQFQATESTIRYGCEVPVALEARLGAFGRALSSAQ